MLDGKLITRRVCVDDTAGGSKFLVDQREMALCKRHMSRLTRGNMRNTSTHGTLRCIARASHPTSVPTLVLPSSHCL